MIQNFFRIAIRNIFKHKGFTFINIAGLAVGLTASLLILLWIQDELSFEKFNVNADNLYRVEQDQFYSGERYHVTVTPHGSGPVWKDKIPEIEEQTRINRLSRILFRQGDHVFFENSIAAADSGLFKMFTLPLIAGDPATALSAPHSIVLAEKLAKKYFGDENPVGRTLTIENKYEFTVTGVMKDIPANSMLRFEGIIPYSYLEEIGVDIETWRSNSIWTFVQTVKGSDVEEVNRKLTEIVKEYNPRSENTFNLFPLLDIHLHSQFGFQQSNGPVMVIYIFSLIAIFVLTIACINFINLSTAKASARSKEIGIRKVAGADQASMIVQFLFESLFLVSIAMVISIILVGLSLDTFNNVSGKSFVLADLVKARFIISFIAVGLFAGLLSGVYPALYLSSIKPIAVLKGDWVSGKGSGKFRKILVVIQFTLSILIAVIAVFLYLQLKYLQDKDLGFDKENLISIPMASDMKDKYYSLKSELQKETKIEGVTGSQRHPVRIGSNAGGASWEGKDPEKDVLIGINGIDYDYLPTMKIELVSGRDFSTEYQSDMARDTTGNFLVNEEVAKLMDIGDPVGRSFSFVGINGMIVGVLKNFHFKGADEPIEPMAFALGDTRFLNYILIRLTPGDIAGSLKAVENVWQEIVPEYPLEYTFIDQDYEDIFRTQIRLTKLLRYFTILAVIIASLGLYGLSSYSAERRTAEIGIRKVMGAGSFNVIYTLSKEFLVLVAVSIMIAIPIGWIVVDKLLNQFAFRIDLNPLVFVAISLGAIIVAMVTISSHAYRATTINPAEALKTE